MFQVAADENFNGRILRALQRRLPALEMIRVQDTELFGADDPSLLEWAAQENRVVLTHDIATLVGYAYERVQDGRVMPGVIAVRSDCPIGQAVEELELLLLASEPGEVENRILFTPL